MFQTRHRRRLLPCASCPALQRLERELGALRARSVNFVAKWAIGRADMPMRVKRNEQLTEELHQAQGQIRSLQDKLFGRKSEKSARGDRSNDLFDPEESRLRRRSAASSPASRATDRRDYSHLPVEEEFIPLPSAMLACPIAGSRPP